MSTSRNESFDLINGIMIMWMVSYHAFQWGHLVESSVFKYLIQFFFFFMPWFYFKSGVFYNKNHPIEELILKDVGRLILPMITWTLIGYFITVPKLIYYEQQPLWKVVVWPFYSFFSSGDTMGNGPLWFLFSLFIVKIIMIPLSKFSLNLLSIIMFLITLLGWKLHTLNIILPLGFSTIPLGLFFTVLGFIYKEASLTKKLSRFLVPIILVLVALSLCFNSYVDIHRNSLWYGDYIYFIIISSLAILSSILVFDKFKFRFLSWVGRKSMYFLVIHWPVFTIIQYAYYLLDFPREGGVYSMLLGLVSILISIFFAKSFSDKSAGLDWIEYIRNYKHYLSKHPRTP